MSRRDKQTADVIRLRGNRGNYSRSQLEAREAEEVKAEPIRGARVPADLKGYALECWKMHAPELERLGLLSSLDLGTFRLCCESYGLALESLDAMKPKKSDGSPDLRRAGHDILLEDPAKGYRPAKNPAFAVFNMATNTYRTLAAELGLSPSARVSLRPGALGKSTPEPAENDGDDLFDFGT